MKALRFRRNLPRYAAARLAGSLTPGRGATGGPLELVDLDLPAEPGPGWVRVRPRLSGICVSDLATVDGRSARYFEPLVSFPFVPGHEVVGDLDDDQRVVLEPVLACASRNITPACAACADGRLVTANTPPSATCPPVFKPVPAMTPEADGPRHSMLIPANSTQCPMGSPTRRRSWWNPRHAVSTLR